MAASPVPWVSSGYLRVKVCGALQHLCLLISSDSAEKKNTVTKQSRFTQMWTILWDSGPPAPSPLPPTFFFFFLHMCFIDSATEGSLGNQKSHLTHILTLYKERRIYGE